MLPQPVHTSKSKWDDSDDSDDDAGPATVTTTLATTVQGPPAYGKRKGFVPRSLKDYGDGGAFPEIHVAQYPLDMGKGDGSANSMAVVPVQVDANGKVKHDVLLRQGQSKDKIIHSTYDSLVPVAITSDDSKRELPDEKAIAEATAKTKAAFDGMVGGQLANAAPTRIKKHDSDAQYIRYTSAQQGEQFNGGAAQRVIRMVNVQNDPLAPPKFKTNKKIPRGPPSPPAPVLHSPSRKVTAEEQSDWKIPPCVSNWKNQKGFTVPLAMRLAADGRGLQDVSINDGFAKLSESLFIAERESRKGIDMRQQITKMAASKEKERKEDHLKALAQMAREERSGLKPQDHESDEVRERDQIRHERSKDRERERRMHAAAPEKRDRLLKDKERDVSERIALGMPAQNTASGGFDTRLYNQSQGMDSGFKGDDSYDVYDKAFRGEKATSIYRPTKKAATEYTEDELEALKATDKFHRPDKGFAGTESSGPASRDGPVQFEKQQMPDEDLFGLDKMLSDAKEGGGGSGGGGSRKRSSSDDGDRGKRARY